MGFSLHKFSKNVNPSVKLTKGKWSRLGLSSWRQKSVGFPVIFSMLYANITAPAGSTITVRLIRETKPKVDDTGWHDYIVPRTGRLRITALWFGARKNVPFHWEMLTDDNGVVVSTRYRKFYN